ncbi:MAG: tyrosine-type recombinase/integrase [Prevotellaceae bacterium]|jgi:integrase|nr:tyrosine-type recombinase/integrase [Prevotellaceae bacterium]
MRRKKIFVRPELRTRKGDLSKKWYVELSQRNPATDEMVRRRVEVLDGVSINSFSTAEERTQAAQKIINTLNELLNNGWTIFSDTSRCVYEDQTQYAHEATVFKRSVEGNATYAYWCSRYIAEAVMQSGLKADSTKDYRSKCRVFAHWLQAMRYDRLDITAIGNDKLVAFFTYLRDTRNAAVRTYRSYRDVLSACFEFIRKNNGILANPVHSLPVNRNVKDMGAERIRRDDLEMLMGELDKVDRQLALACRFEYYCGLRPGYELRLLKVGDIDFRRGYSKVRVALENAKTSRRREVAIPDVFLDYLLREWQLDACDRNMYIFGKSGAPGREHLGKNNLRFRFVRIRKKLGLPVEYKLYSMKHTGATTLAELGEPIINIRDHLGHTSIQTTEHYLKRHGVNEALHIRSNFPSI